MKTATTMASLLMALCLFAGDSHAEQGQADDIGPIPPGYRPASNTDESELWYIEAKQEVELKQSPRLIRDPELNAYVRRVTCKVTGDYCKDLRIYILDVPYFNAMMTPSGIMVIWSGALLRIQNEAELALIIGHEFGHFKNRHSLQQFRKIKKSSAFLNTVGVLTYGTGADLVANLIGIASLQKFSRDHEREADKTGFSTVVNNGYDPRVGALLWDRMLQEEKAADYGKPLPVFASHPKSQERRDDLQAAAAAIDNPSSQRDAEAYRHETEKFQQQWLEGELSRRMYQSSIVVMTELLSVSPAEHKGLYTFFLAEAHRRKNKEGDRAKADELYAQATQLPDAPSGAWREYGLALKSANNKPAALAALNRYLALDPKADDRLFIEQYLKELQVAP